jgi:hypothetical protein
VTIRLLSGALAFPPPFAERCRSSSTPARGADTGNHKGLTPSAGKQWSSTRRQIVQRFLEGPASVLARHGVEIEALEMANAQLTVS